MYCKECAFWENRICNNENKIREDLFVEKEELVDEMVYPYDEGGVFQTGPLFGCVHCTPKEPTKC